MTQCHRNRLHFQGHGRREVVAQFDGGMITSDAGGLLLREVNDTFGVIRKFACVKLVTGSPPEIKYEQETVSLLNFRSAVDGGMRAERRRTEDDRS